MPLEPKHHGFRISAGPAMLVLLIPFQRDGLKGILTAQKGLPFCIPLQ